MAEGALVLSLIMSSSISAIVRFARDGAENWPIGLLLLLLSNRCLIRIRQHRLVDSALICLAQHRALLKTFTRWVAPILLRDVVDLLALHELAIVVLLEG